MQGTGGTGGKGLVTIYGEGGLQNGRVNFNPTKRGGREKF